MYHIAHIRTHIRARRDTSQVQKQQPAATQRLRTTPLDTSARHSARDSLRQCTLARATATCCASLAACHSSLQRGSHRIRAERPATFASSRSSRAAAQQHCSSQMTIASMYVLKAAATNVDDYLQLEHQRCQTSGGMPSDRPEAVAVCAGRPRSVAAASTTAAKWPPDGSKVGFK